MTPAEDTFEHDREPDPDDRRDHFSTEDDDTAGRSWKITSEKEVDDLPDLRDRTSRTSQDRDEDGRFSAEEER